MLVGECEKEGAPSLLGDGAAGRETPPDERLKKSVALKGRERGAEHCANIAKAQQGHAVREETRQKIAAALMGRKVPADVVERLRQANVGRPCSPEKREKISRAQKGISRMTQEQRAHLSAMWKGVQRPIEAIDRGCKFPRHVAAAHLKALAESGLSQAEYCRLHGVSPQTLCGWKRSEPIKLLQTSPPDRSRFEIGIPANAKKLPD
jgi:hypothetical protein